MYYELKFTCNIKRKGERMKYTGWTICNNEYEAEKKRSRDALFTIGNGYFGIRGFFEEDTEDVDRLGGIYMAGIVGRGTYPAWEGTSRELCNVTNIFRVKLLADKENIRITDKAEDFYQMVDLKSGMYSRGYVYTTNSHKKIKISFVRFASMHNRHLAGQKIEIEALTDNVEIQAGRFLDTNVTNLNKESCEPYPIQPGRNHIIEREISGNHVVTTLDDVDKTRLYFAQHLESCGENRKQVTDEFACGETEIFVLEKGEKRIFTKVVCAYNSKYDKEPEQQIKAFLNADICYEEELRKHTEAWKEKWDVSDITISGNEDDQAVLRYNIFHLLCVCPEHTDKLSIGARGLTGEMYEGCVFWDNEIFKFPFFVYTNPEAARKLLMFRYHTLEAAKRHAKRNWFEGAMYPWQVCEKGIEQTPYNVGAYYSIHVISDIAHAVQQYWNVTGDDEFVLKYGAEILLETARFFAGRVDYDEEAKAYVIRAVRGPNEYDVIVNNNAYTNVMAVENMKTAEKAFRTLEEKYPEELEKFINEHNVTKEERQKWEEIGKNILIPYVKKDKLYLEDDAYLKRRPVDMKKAKPTGKRIIDTTIPYEALMMYQVSKQADVVHMMNLLPHMFTDEEKRIAYEFYEPKTCHDSSLSYSQYGVMAANLNNEEETYRYFRKAAYLDIDDRQLNTISGLHFANFGGTWQLAYFGYAGISEDNNVLYINPNLPKVWNEMKLTVVFRGNRVKVCVSDKKLQLELQNKQGELFVNVDGREYKLTGEEPRIQMDR